MAIEEEVVEKATKDGIYEPGKYLWKAVKGKTAKNPKEILENFEK